MPVDLLAQRIYAIALGDEDVNDHTQLRHDVVTNLEGTPQHLYEEIYCARGDMENRIKEQQLWLLALIVW